MNNVASGFCRGTRSDELCGGVRRLRNKDGQKSCMCRAICCRIFRPGFVSYISSIAAETSSGCEQVQRQSKIWIRRCVIFCFRNLLNVGQSGPGKVCDENFRIKIALVLARSRFARDRNATFPPLADNDGFCWSVLLTPGIVSAVRVPCAKVFVPGANPPAERQKNNSGLKSGFPITLPAVGTRSRVEINAMRVAIVTDRRFTIVVNHIG